MEYQPLNVARNEIRILKLPPRLRNEDALPIDRATLNLPPLTVQNVSLDDFSHDFKIYAAEERAGITPPGDYYRWVDNRRIKTGIKRNLFTAADVEGNFGRGRWEWGDFSAISYMWGETLNERDIVINGCPFRVRENLYNILRDFWLEPQSTAHEIWSNIWVDAICINQNDIEERSSQVARMGDIYKQAIAVVGFVASADINIDRAVNFIKTIANQWYKLADKPEGHVIKSPLYALDQNTLEEVRTFFGLPYWNRLWIVQEIAVSFERLAFGTLSSLDLLSACAYLDHFDNLRTDLARICSEHSEQGIIGISNFLDQFQRVKDLMELHHTSTRSGSIRSLIDLSRISRTSQQKDDRDKIYGIFNLMDPDFANSIIPNYSNSVCQVYVDFTKSVIMHTNSLNYICGNRACLQDQAEIPSWVPDWRVPLRTAIEIEADNSHHTSGDRGADLRVDNQNNFLIVKGFRFDVVDGMSTGFNNNKTLVTSDTKWTPTKGYSIAYANDEVVKDALCRTMIADRGQSEELLSKLDGLLCIPWNFASSELISISDDDKTHLEMFHQLRLMNSNLSIGGISLRKYYMPRTNSGQDVSTVATSELFRYAVRTAVHVAVGRKLVITEKGRFALASSLAEQGDVICVLFGCSVPVILRHDKKHWKLVGECYLHGIMKGEAMKPFENGKFHQEEFIIG